MAPEDELKQLQVLRFALESIESQWDAIFGVMNAVHAMEHVLRADYPDVHARYLRILDTIRSASAQAQRTTAQHVEQVTAIARALVEKSEKSQK